MSFEFGLPSIAAYFPKEHHSSSCSSFLSSANKKYWLVGKCYLIGAFEARGTHIFRSTSRHFVQRDQNKLCAHDNCGKRAELWVKINLFDVFVMYALDSAHETVQHMK